MSRIHPHPVSRLDRRGLVALAGMTAANAAAQTPVIIDLSVLPGGTVSYTNAVSADGSAVAGVSGSAAGERAFRWTAAAGLENLGVLPGGLFSQGNGISADGRVVAGTSGSSLGNRAFRWTAGGGLQGLDPLPGSTTSSGSCVSGDGLTVGGSSGGDLDAIRWLPGGEAQLVYLHSTTGGPFPSFTTGAAAAISNDGAVLAVNLSTVQWEGKPGFGAYRWTPGGMEFVGGSFASAVSADGAAMAGYTVVGYSWEYRYSAFRWTATGGTQDLGSLSASGASVARAISGDGRVVVGADGYTAFLWTGALGMVDLNAYLPSVGVDLTGWVLTDARGLNLDGSVIVGNGYLNGQARGWIATIPAPPSCYANCDGSTSTPILNVNDFACFLDRFAAGDAHANCDGSTMPPALNVLDLACFLNQFATGCP
jgi:probable HAF family extracellular repeat protein